MAVGLVRRGVAIPKSLKDMCILDILDGATEDRPLTQEEIRQRLADDYGIVVDRKTLHRRLELLMGSVESLRCREEARDGTDGVKTDFWMEREPLFEDSEARALTYLVIFSRHIPSRIKKGLVEKLESVSGGGLHRELRSYVVGDGGKAKDYNELFLNIDLLSEAIAAKRKVAFRYKVYGADKKLRAEEHTITVSPFSIGVSDGDFYLLATTNGVKDDSPGRMIAHFQDVLDAMEAGEARLDTYRLDRMSGVEVLEEARERLDDPDALHLAGADGRGDRLDVREHLRENPFLLPGHRVRAEFLLMEGPQCTIGDVIDRFGEHVSVACETPTEHGVSATYRVALSTNLEGLRRFALLNPASVEVVRPESLRHELHDAFAAAAERTQ